jgi:sulfur-carrier protein adenylyltransferase/sulfurtransferase
MPQAESFELPRKFQEFLMATVIGSQAATLSNDEILRYSRHLIMPEVGMEGQLKLKQAKVLCVGAGGLGSPLSLYLTAAGVGTLGMVDFDVVDFTNLHRQVIHGTSDVGKKKLDSAEETLREINPNVEIRKYETKLTSVNALDIFREFDIIADGTDNFPTRYLVNDACVLTGKPNVYGSIFRFEGQASVFATKAGPCYRCLYPEPPPPGMVPSCAEGGVLGILPGLVGVIQATETIKLILGAGEPLIGRLLLVDALGMRFRELKLRKNPECPACGTQPTVTKLIDYNQFCGIRGEETAAPTHMADMTVEELKQRLDRGDDLFVLDVREPHEYQIANIGGHLIPLNDLPKRVSELDSSKDIVVHCKMGGRSAKAADFLRQSGFSRVHNLAGGINAWAERIDPKVPKY